MKQVLFTLLLVFGSMFGFSQTDGDYRTASSGTWNTVASWEVFNSGAWRSLGDPSAGPYLNVIPSSASGVISVNHTIHITTNLAINQTIIQVDGWLELDPSRTLTILDDLTNTPLTVDVGGVLLIGGTLDLSTQLVSTPCIINGDVASYATIVTANPALLVFNNGSRYLHSNASAGAIPRATWAVNSTVEINGMSKANPQPPTNLNQSFGNFRWYTLAMAATTSFSLNGLLTDVKGDLVISSTGDVTPREVRLKFGGIGYTLNIGGNLIIEGGNLTLTQNQTSTTSIHIGGNLLITGGRLNLATQNNNETDIFLHGNFQKSGGTLTRVSGVGAATFRFSGSNATYSNNANITSNISFAVQNGNVLNLGTTYLSGNGTFTLNSGGTLRVGSLDPGGAIQLGTAGGNIRMASARAYFAGTTIIYDGLGPQFMGTGHPAGPTTIISNAAGVTLLSDVTFNADLITNGPFDPQQRTVSFRGGSPQAISGTNSIPFYNLTLNQTAPSTLTLSTTISVANNLSIPSVSTFAAGNQRLVLLSTPTRTANVNQMPAGASITGTVVVQRYLPKAVPRNQIHHVASPVTNSSIPDWRSDGLPIVKVYRWNEPTRAYISMSLASPTVNGIGYLIDVNSPATFTMDSRGTLGQGNVNVALTSQSPVVSSPDGWNHIGNPYPSAIDWDNVARPAGVLNSIYFRDNFGNSGQGPEPGKVVTYVDGVGTPAGYAGAIAQGQGFWVKATANATLTFTEAAKITPTNTPFFREGEIPNVLRIMIAGEAGEDEAVVRLREGATDQFDGQFDAYKYLENEFNLATLTADNVKTAINAFGTAECNKIVPMVVAGSEAGNYTLNFTGIESFDAAISVSLLDVVENKTVDIRKQKEYSFAITDSNKDSMGSRFQLSFEGTSTEVNTSVKAAGETVCKDQSTAIISLDTSELGVEYLAQWNGKGISQAIAGTGSSLQLMVDATELLPGENTITIKAQRGVCSVAELTSRPVIKKAEAGEINIVSSGNVCQQGTATLIVSGASQDGWYNWYESVDDKDPIAGQSGAEFVTPDLVKSKTYYVAAANGLGCEGKRVPIKAIVSYQEAVSLTVKGSLLISNIADGNQWYKDGEILDSEKSSVLEAYEPGLYTVTVTDGKCTTSASHLIEQGAGEAGISIFPNPTTDKVFIKVKTTNNNVVATLVSTQGVEIGSKELLGTGVKETEFDLASFASGIYHVRITDGQKIIIKKIAKTK